MKALSIRSIERGDIDVLAAMSRELEQATNILRKEHDKKAMTRTAFLEDGFGSNPAFSGLMAMVGDQPTAYMLYHPSYMIDYAARSIQIIDLFVTRLARGSGVATHMMSAIIPIAKAGGASIICSSVRNMTLEMKGFYKQIGVQFVKDQTTLIWHRENWPG